MLREPYRIQLLGGLCLRRAEEVITRFPAHKVGGLFAYLAYYAERSHPRDELADRFWPDADPEAGRVNLRSALAALRRQLAAPEVAAEQILIADRFTVRLDAGEIRTDVATFLREIQVAARADSPSRQIEAWERANSLYHGELLPGHYDDWVMVERGRLAETRLRMLLQLSVALEQQNDYVRAIACVRVAVQDDPLNEAAHSALIRQYAASGQMTAAARQYQEWGRILSEELDAAPEVSFEEIVREARHEALKSEPLTGGMRETGDAVIATPPSTEPASPAPPPGASAGFRPLPTPLTPFYGREQEIDEIIALLETAGTRLVTLTGLGGTGKTRLSIEIANRLHRAEHRQICFVPLADLADAAHMGEALLAVLESPASASETALDRIVSRLHDRPVLLVLDNFEQLLNAQTGASYVASMLERLPLLQCLITSRLPLGISGEWEFPLAPLPTPSAPALPERLLQFASVRLFVGCAQAVRPDFRLTAANAQPIAQLCYSLEGVPLALELAAARAQILTPTQMLTQLSGCLDLASRHRDAVDRHRSLRAALDWSFQLLSPELQRFFASLSIFRGGWTLDAATALCEPYGDEDINPDLGTFRLQPGSACLDLLEQLRAHSLIYTEERNQEMRFRMLEMVRQYGEEKLAAYGFGDTIRMRCIDFFYRFVLETAVQMSGTEQAGAMNRIEAEHDNLRMVLTSCRTPAQLQQALSLAGRLAQFWTVRGHIEEGLERTVALLAHPETAERTAARAEALYGAGYLAWYRSDYETARQYIEASLAIRRESGNTRGVAEALFRLGAMALFLDSNAEARTLLIESRSLWESAGDELGLALTVARLSELQRKQGDLLAARSLALESLALLRRAGAVWETGYVLWCLGNIACDEPDYHAAAEYYGQAIRAVRATGDISNLPLYLESLGHAAYASDQRERAVRLFAAAAGLRTKHAIRPLPDAAARVERCLNQMRAMWGQERFLTLWTEAGDLPLDAILAFATRSEPVAPISISPPQN